MRAEENDLIYGIKLSSMSMSRLFFIDDSYLFFKNKESVVINVV